jgi:hypothetical protein
MADEQRCDYEVPGEITDEEAFAFMVEAFATGMIGPFERLPVLRLFTGQADLVFVIGEGADTPQQVVNRASTIRISPAVQLQLVDHFSHLLAAN